jgi:putative protease
MEREVEGMNFKRERGGAAANDRRCELLSPAGSFDAACAAFAFGADAIYLGLRRLSARAEAANFSIDELRSICTYAHSLMPRRNVHVTLNTLLRDSELGEATEAALAVAEAGADAAIVQDLAVAAIARRVAPSLTLHASTQMFVHGIEGAQAARELGFSRVVLARELTFDEVAAITASAGIETEVFIQGALCYGYSGQCLFSALATGRSGNRGQCAYCCRSRFARPGGGAASFPFSMRDLSLGTAVRRLRDIGVASLKIEGRMKSPLYVAAATRLYRLILDGEAGDDEIAEAADDLKTVFSRPATTLYFHGHNTPDKIIDPETVGHRGCPVGKIEAITGGRQARAIRLTPTRSLELHDGIQIDLPGRPYGFALDSMRPAGSRMTVTTAPAGAAVDIALPQDAPRLPVGATVSCASSQATKRRLSFPKPRAAELAPSRTVGAEVILAPDSISAKAALGGGEVAVSVPATLSAAQNPERTAEAVRGAFARTGGTQWRFAPVEVSDPQSLFAPASLLNALRRELCEALDARQAQISGEKAVEAAETVGAWLAEPLGDDGRIPKGLSIKTPFGSSPRALECGEVVLQLMREDCRDEARLEKTLAAWRAVAPALRVALPLVVRNGDLAVVERAVERLAALGVGAWEVGEISMLRLVRRVCGEGVTVTAAPSLYALNAAAARRLREMGVSAAVIPAEADEADAEALCSKDPGFFIANAESRPALFVSETRPLADGAASASHFALEDVGGHRYEVMRRDGLWITRQAEARRIAVPATALRWRREID